MDSILDMKYLILILINHDKYKDDDFQITKERSDFLIIQHSLLQSKEFALNSTW